MRGIILKALPVIWFIGALALLVFVGRQQSHIFEAVIQHGSIPDLRSLRHENHLLAIRPEFLIPYVLLIGSAFIALLGPQRQTLTTKEGKWFLAVLITSLMAYLTLLLDWP